MTVAREVLAATATGSRVIANLATGFTSISEAHSVASSPCHTSDTSQSCHKGGRSPRLNLHQIPCDGIFDPSLTLNSTYIPCDKKLLL